jgi:hypothetical protein
MAVPTLLAAAQELVGAGPTAPHAGALPRGTRRC